MRAKTRQWSIQLALYLKTRHSDLLSIVFVHGLNGHRERTWNASNGVIWSKDLLPYDLPQSRIYSWGYDARVASFSQISKQYLLDDAESLVSQLEMKRDQTKVAYMLNHHPTRTGQY